MNTEQINEIQSFISRLEGNKNTFHSITPAFLKELSTSLKEIHNLNLQKQDEVKVIINAVNQCQRILNLLKTPVEIGIEDSYFKAVDKLITTLKNLVGHIYN